MADTNTFYVFEAPPTIVERAAIGRIDSARIRAPRENLTVVLSTDANAELGATLARELSARSWVVDIRKTDSELCRVHAFDPTGAKRWARTCIPNEVAKELKAMGLGDPDNPNLTDAQRDTQRAFLESAFHGPVAVLEQEVGLKVFDWPKFELAEAITGATAETVAEAAASTAVAATENGGPELEDAADSSKPEPSDESTSLLEDAVSGEDDVEAEEESADEAEGDEDAASEEAEPEKTVTKKKAAAPKKKAPAKKKAAAPKKAAAAKKKAAPARSAKKKK